MAEPLSDDCPLSPADQTRNVLIVAANTALSYLAAPVSYVDAYHTALLNDLQKDAGLQPSDALSNLPAAAYMVFTVLPVLVAWAFPQIRLLRRIVTCCYLTMAFAGALVAAALLLPLPWWLQAAFVIGHGAVMGGARTVGVAIEFEVLGIAVSPRRRGQALGLAYGLGPVLAVVGNLLGQWLLDKEARPFPVNFAAVFGVSVPVFALIALCSSRLVIPLPEHEMPRQPFLAGVFGGFGQFIGQRVVLLAVVLSILIFSGYQIINNMTLYAGVLFRSDPSDTAGYQKAVLYTFKVLMGLSMGWLLTRSSPRSAVLISAAFGLGSVLFAIVAPPAVYLLSFGLLGGGQLFGIYITNYVLNCAPKALMRRYMAFMMLTAMPAAPAGAIYGAISDYFGELYDKQFGFQMSFAAAASLIAAGILLALFLPARPKPQEQ